MGWAHWTGLWAWLDFGLGPNDNRVISGERLKEVSTWTVCKGPQCLLSWKPDACSIKTCWTQGLLLSVRAVAQEIHHCFHMFVIKSNIVWTASSEFGTYRLCEQRRFRRACASAQSRQNLRCSLIQAVSQEEPSDSQISGPSEWLGMRS